VQYFLCGHCKHLHCCVLLSSSIFLPRSLFLSLPIYLSLSVCMQLRFEPTPHLPHTHTSPLTFAEHPVGNKTLFHPINRRQLLHRWWFFFRSRTRRALFRPSVPFPRRPPHFYSPSAAHRHTTSCSPCH